MRLIEYLLEHGYRWVSGDPAHAHFWNAPFFYPLTNTTALSETFLGAAPFYWVPRWLGAGPDTALTLWLMLQMAADFAAFLLFARRSLRLSWMAALAGAYLFAFASIRLNQLGHAQLLGQFFTILALHGLWKIFAGRDPSVAPGLALFTSMTVLQFYAGFYLGWFFALALVLACLVTVATPPGRVALMDLIRRGRTPSAVAILGAGAVLLLPLGWHYLGAAGVVGMRDFAEIGTMLPHWRSWLDIGPNNWVYGRWHQTLIPAGALDVEWEHRIGLGLIAMTTALIGIWNVRREAWAVVLFATAALLVVISLKVRGVTLWTGVYYAFPAAGSIRAVTRIAVFLLVPASIAAALGIQTLVTHGRVVLAVLLITGIVAEQRMDTPAYEIAPLAAREEALAARIGSACVAFVYTPSPAPCRTDDAWSTKHLRAVTAHLDAMATSNRLGIPTLNGYTGSLPPRYPFWGLDYCGPGDDVTIPRLIRTWCADHGCNPRSVCWIH